MKKSKGAKQSSDGIIINAFVTGLRKGDGDMQTIRVERTACPKEKPGKDNPLVFGTIFTDHMFEMDYEEGKGWIDPRVVPYHKLELEPSCMVFHYGQEMFEGLKAYRAKDGRILLFRPDMNAKRANRSNRRICIPEIPDELFIEAIKTVVKVDQDWIPTKPGTSLYIRPFIIATDPFLGVRPSHTYKFMVILSPVGAYYASGLDPVKIWIEDEYVRAVKGGIGEAKTGGNYVASLASQVKAHDEGYAQVLWLDGVERKYIEEVGAMNIFFKINGTAVKTPQGCTWSLQDLSSDDSGRTLDGIMHKDIVAQKRKLVCKWSAMTWQECSVITNFMKNKGVEVSLTYPDIMAGNYITKVFYTGDMSVSYFDWSRELVESASCDFIEI